MSKEFKKFIEFKKLREMYGINTSFLLTLLTLLTL